MTETVICEKCGRTIKDEPVQKTLRGKKHLFCSEFCFRLYFYDAPNVKFTDLQKMYKVRCVDLHPQDFSKLL